MSQSAYPPAALDNLQLYHACRSDNPAEQAAAFRSLWNYLLPILTAMVHTQADASDFAQDCAQRTLIRIYERYHECHDPAAFLPWARRIARNLTIDELRRRGRFTALPDEGETTPLASSAPFITNPEHSTLTTLTTAELRLLLDQSPMSERSRRVVIGRYLDDVADEALAESESRLSQTEVLPSHIQVTRAKNLAKLRNWATLRTFLDLDVRKDS